VLLATEFQILADFWTYLKISNTGIAKMETPRRFLDDRNVYFQMRDYGLETRLQDAVTYDSLHSAHCKDRETEGKNQDKNQTVKPTNPPGEKPGRPTLTDVDF